MGFARLEYSSGVNNEPGKVLVDIINVITGSSPTYANASSVVVNTRATNWTLVSGTVGINTSAYTLSAPCVTAGKTKFVQIASVSYVAAGTATPAYTFGSTPFNSTMLFNGAASSQQPGIWMSACSTAAGANSTSNIGGETTNYRHLKQAFTFTSPTNGKMIYLSWSNRHILIYGQSAQNYISAGGNAYYVNAVVEYPETALTLARNVAPFTHLTFGYGTSSPVSVTDTNPTVTAAQSILLMTNPIGADISSTTNLQTLASTTNTALTNAVSVGIRGNGTAILEHRTIVATTGQVAGTTAYNFVPLFWSMPNEGIPTFDWSSLSDIYVTSKNATVQGGELPSGSDTYVYLPLCDSVSSTTQSGAIVVKKS